MNRLKLISLVLAAAAVAWAASHTPNAQRANLRVPQNAFPEVYIQGDVDSDSKCLVGDRAATTAKRSESRLGKASWRCRTETRTGAPPAFVADSKRQPSFLFVPVTDVEDLAFPLAYEMIRQGESLALPRQRWVHLFYDRHFLGLYLEVTLPGRHFAAERLEARVASEPPPPTEDEEEGPGAEKLELLSVRGDELRCFDRKMRPVCPVYNLALADGVFPRPHFEPGTALLGALVAASPARTFILSDARYDHLEPLPLAVDPGALLDRDPYVDQRYQRWQEIPGDPLAGELAARYRERLLEDTELLETYRQGLTTSLAASCAIMHCEPEVLWRRLSEGPVARWLEAS
jgi:hypothetical protein